MVMPNIARAIKIGQDHAATGTLDIVIHAAEDA